MARIAGVDLPKKKRMEIALTYIFGVGRSSATDILTAASVNPAKKSDDLTDEEINAIRTVLDASYRVEGDLRRGISMSIKRLMDLGSYRGLRHRKSLPVNGQRTRTNSRTRKGPRRGLAIKKK
ncbi:MAG: 30S ribosomal protein S13 [Deltaproteobacteria bacterium]|nr:30S ribosomal protein S13 [Deltaproteobacteria bacterium]